MAERTTPGTRVALTIGGSDSSGGAGIQADLKVFAAMDVFGTTAITAVTAQNTKGVHHALTLPPELVEQQIDAVASDIKVDALKTGMLGSAAVVEVVARTIRRNNLAPLVVDPVMEAKRGDSLMEDDAVAVLCRRLLPLAAVVTPNRAEAARLLGRGSPITDVFGATGAARDICRRFGARACIVKGIRRPNSQEGDAVDVFVWRDENGKERVDEIVAEWRPTPNTNGSGCTFSAAIAAGLARGQPLGEAVQTAKNLVTEAIRQTTDLGGGVSPVNHLAYAKVKK